MGGDLMIEFKIKTILILFLTAIALYGLIRIGLYFEISKENSYRNIKTSLLYSKNGTIEYLTKGSGIPILVSHGSGGGFDQGLMMTEAAGSGFQLIVPSRFGYLKSSAPSNASAEQQADAYIELLDHLKISKVNVLAISAGAWSALQFAAKYPDRCSSLTLIVPANALPVGVPNYGGPFIKIMFSSDSLIWITAHLAKYFPSLFAPMVFGVPSSVISSANNNELDRLNKLFFGLLPVTTRMTGMAIDMKEAQSPQPCNYSKINAPVFILSAEDDQFGTHVRGKEIISKVKNGKIYIFSNGGHALVGRQSEVFERAREFIVSVDKDK